jgi:L-seryl-tRNA(Ser) seleniumtransferase
VSQTSSVGRPTLPSVERILIAPELERLVSCHGRELVLRTVRQLFNELRLQGGDTGLLTGVTIEELAPLIIDSVEKLVGSKLRTVFNLTGTVLHTNLGRASLPAQAIDAVCEAARSSTNLEFDLETGKRGNRDSHLEQLLIYLTGAEAATVVNNNAAAVFLCLNTFGLRREVPVSRGELVEIGGAFRLPDIMTRAGTRIREVGTTNRTHPADFRNAISAKTALLLKVHTSNYEINGFTKEVGVEALAGLAREHNIPLMVDLGSGTLVDLKKYGLPDEPTVSANVAAGADLVTFSGDKLLGGPQAGLIVGKRELIDKINKNPLKRCFRLDKMTIAALEAVLRLYTDPSQVRMHIPAFAMLTRPLLEIESSAARLCSLLAPVLAGIATIKIVACSSQIGSGSLPVDTLPSCGLSVEPVANRRSASREAERVARAFRTLRKPVIGRISKGRLLLDLRCLDDEDGFISQLPELVDALAAAS